MNFLTLAINTCFERVQILKFFKSTVFFDKFCTRKGGQGNLSIEWKELKQKKIANK